MLRALYYLRLNEKQKSLDLVQRMLLFAHNVKVMTSLAHSISPSQRDFTFMQDRSIATVEHIVMVELLSTVCLDCDMDLKASNQFCSQADH
jgi:hypothetical protein